MTEERLGTVGWGLFFLWIGLALILGFQLHISLIGIGVIILGMQLVRKYFKFKFETFWLVVGICLIFFSLVKIPQINIPVIPILLIVFGILFFISAFKKKQ
jgi:hypothetical protein